MLPAASTSSSSSSAAFLPLPAAAPLKFRRKSQGAVDVDLEPHIHPHATRVSAQRVWRDSYSSDASSPIVSTAALSSEPSSPVEFSRIRYQSSPAYSYKIGTRDAYEYEHDRQGSRKASPSRSHFSSSSYYYASSRQPSSPLFPSHGSSFSYSSPSEGSEGPPMTSDFDMDAASVYSDDTRTELDDGVDMDMDDNSPFHRRRLSFSTSSERDQPLIRDRSKPIPIPSTSACVSSVFTSAHPSVLKMMDAVVSVQDDGCNYLERNVSSMQTSESFATTRRRHERPSPAFSLFALPPSDPPMPSPIVSVSAALPISALLCPTGRNPTEPPLTPPQKLADMPRHQKSPSLAMLLNPSPPAAIESVTSRVEPSPSTSPTLPISPLSEAGRQSDNASMCLELESAVDPIALPCGGSETPPLTECNSTPEVLPNDQQSDAMSSPLSSLPSSPPHIPYGADVLDEVHTILPLSMTNGIYDNCTEKIKMAEASVLRTTRPRLTSLTQKRANSTHTPLPKMQRHRSEGFQHSTEPSMRSPSPLISIVTPPSVKAERYSTEPIPGYIDIESHPKANTRTGDVNRDLKRQCKGEGGRAKKQVRMSTGLEAILPEDLFKEESGSEAKKSGKGATRVKRLDQPAKARKGKAGSRADDVAGPSKAVSSATKFPRPSKGSASKKAAQADGATRTPSQTVELLQDIPIPCAEMQGMLIETLATSRASSLPASALYSALVAARPSLKDMPSSQGEKLGKKEWVRAIEIVLEAGRNDPGVFGKVDTAQEAADHALEAQWFYVPEQDEDQERATLLRSIMPRPGKRNETKKCKQYYWRPLAKISRWDPEDDL